MNLSDTHSDVRPSSSEILARGATLSLVACGRICSRRGFIHGDLLTVTGKSMKKNLESSKLDILSSDERANIIRPVYNPIDKKGSLKILKGSLAPEGAVVKIASIKSASFLGKARTTSS